jgi:hypothetical protein
LDGIGLKTILKEISLPITLFLAGIATVSLFIPNPGYYYYDYLSMAFDPSKISQEIYQIIATYHVGWLPILMTLTHLLKKEDKLLATSLVVGGGFILLDHFIGIVASKRRILLFQPPPIQVSRSYSQMGMTKISGEVKHYMGLNILAVSQGPASSSGGLG